MRTTWCKVVRFHAVRMDRNEHMQPLTQTADAGKEPAVVIGK